MKLKNYLLIVILLIASVFSLNAQVNFRNSSEQVELKPANLKKGIVANVPFAPRIPGTSGSVKVRGDVVFVGNHITQATNDTGSGSNNTSSPFVALYPTYTPFNSANIDNLTALTNMANVNNNSNSVNDNKNFEYIDVDTDPTTFSSSSADLALKNTDGSVNNCKRIVYAGLYWSALYSNDRTEQLSPASGSNPAFIHPATPISPDWNKVKFKVPGGSYINLTADNAVDSLGDEDAIIIDPVSGGLTGSPYTCYKNVTSLLSGLTDANGTYTLANMRSTRGTISSVAGSGWTLVIIYESPSFPSKYITVFDGYQDISSTSPPVYYDLSGFQTKPTGPVRAKFGFAGLEGDTTFNGDAISIKSPISGTPASGTYYNISNSLNPTDNILNSSITTMSTSVTPIPNFVVNRAPFGINTMGFDLDLMEIPNTSNIIIANNATNATIKLETGTTTASDAYGVFLNTFAIDIIEPRIVLNKIVKNNAGVVISGTTPVSLGQTLNYNISYQNIGNDNAINFTIKDILPLNVIFNPSLMTLPAGVTFTYNVVTREIIFTIPNNQVLANSILPNTIIIPVTIDPNRLAFINACSNIITNSAFANYRGELSGLSVNEQLSYAYFSSSLCYIDLPSATINTVNVGTSNFVKDEVLCGTSLILTAPTGYTSYSWTNPLVSGTTVIGTGSTLTVSAIGTYLVSCNIVSPCTPANVTFIVTPFGSGITNPIIPYSDVVPLPICTSNNEPMPIIKLCGNQNKQINLTIAAALSITWEKLVDTSCPVNLFPNCAILNPPSPALPCSWSAVSTTSSYNVINAGQYRITIVYQGGCSRIFYFNVFKSNLTPTYEKKDISCIRQGEIKVNGMPTNYEYQLERLSPAPTGIIVPYQNNNVFNINVAGDYIIRTRIVGAGPFDCVYVSPTITILDVSSTFVMTATPIQPLCFGQKGTIEIQINGATPQYTYNVTYSKLPTIPVGLYINSGPINANTYQLTNLSAGTYTITGSSQNGCSFTKTVVIVEPQKLELTAGITTALTCKPGLIDFYPVGGSGTYTYQVTTNGVVGSFTSDDFIDVPVPNPNTGNPITTNYSIKVVDYNNCEATTSISITSRPKPTFNITTTPIKCFGNNDGTLTFNITANLGNYDLSYSIDNGNTYQSSPNFVNLLGGLKKCIVRYTLPGEPSCFRSVQNIIVDQPITGLTASGGVSQLACLNTGTGVIRITNPQGGSPYLTGSPYLYYFNGPPPVFPLTTGSQTTIESIKAPGTYTVYIQDASGCSFPMIVILDPVITPPTISLGAPVFNCDGTSTNTVTVNNNGGNFAYEYILDPPNPINTGVTPNVFNNVVCGTHTVRVNYKATNIPTYSNLLNETFGSGLNTTTPGIAAAYCFHDLTLPLPHNCSQPTDATLQDNQYAVTAGLIPNNGNWYPYRDHTSNGTDPIGRFLAINIGGAAGANGILYSQTISNILPNQPVKVELYVANLLNVGNGLDDPSFLLELVDSSGNPIGGAAGQVSTGIIDNDPTVPPDPSYVANGWRFKKITLNPGNNTTLKFNIRSGSVVYQGNDAAIDDIKVFQEPIACASFKDFPINIPCGNIFNSQITSYSNVKCASDTNGTITIAAQYFNTTTGFYYQLNGAGTVFNSLTSPVVINNLPVGTTSIKVGFDSALLTCVKTLTQVIAAPPVLVATATPTQATCDVPAIITATATGGTATYQYQLETLSGTIFTPYQSSNIFNPVAVGSYVVRIKDSNNCIKVSPTVTINVIPLPTAIIAPTSDLCYDGTNGATIVVTASGGLAPYQYAISPIYTFANPNSFPVLPGSHIIKVRDANGCIFTLPTQIIAPQLTIDAVLTKDIDCSVTPNGLITGTVSGGTSPYTYQINTGTVYGAALPFSPVGGNVMTYSSATAGTVKIKVTDATGCSSESTLINITTPTPITGQAIATQATCGLNNATVTLSALTGTPGYTYSFNSPGNFTTTTVYSNIGPGTYNYQIKDSKFCVFSGIVTVTSPSAITGSAVISTPYTCSGLGCITISASNGTSPYTYSLGVTFVSNPQFCNLTNGTYTPVIKDASGCTLTLPTITIAPLNPPTNITFSNTAPNCPSQTANVTVNAVATNPITTYQITAPASAITSQTTNVFNNLAVGTYTFRVTDDKLCTYTETYTIVPVTPISVVGQLVNNVQCFGSSTGNIKFTVSGFSSNFNYQIGSNPIVTNYSSSVINFTNQPAGSYTIIVTDNVTNCTATATVDIVQPAVALSITKVVTQKTCASAGSVTITAVGGWGSNVFELTTPAPVTTTTNTNGTFPALTITGTYTIKVTDGNGCVVTDTFDLVAPISPVISVDPISDFCYDGVNGASVTVNATGGLPPYQYFNGTVLNNNIPSNVFVNLNPGSYSLSVKDSADCTTALLLPVVIAPQLTVSAVKTKDLDCSASPNAIYTFTVAGGYPGYSYQVNFNSSGYLPLVPLTFAGNVFTYTLASGTLTGAGNYIIKITDSKGCTVSRTIDLLPIVPVAATHVVTNVKCNGSNTGVVSITPSGGSGTGYQVNFNDLGFSPTLTYSGLVAGSYPYVVKDSKDCIFNGTAVVTNLYDPISATTAYDDITFPFGTNCAGTVVCNGAIRLTNITGGLAPYTITLYDLTGGNFPDERTGVIATSLNFNNLCFGEYEVTIVDSNNCSKSYFFTIGLPPNGININTSVGPVSCAAGASITLTLSGLLLPSSTTFQYALYVPSGLTPSPPNSPFQTIAINPTIYTGPLGITYTFTGLDPGTLYKFVVFSNSNQCYYFQQATTAVLPITPLNVTNLVVNNVSCSGNDDASVNFTVNNYNALSVSYAIYTGNNVTTGISGTQTGLTGAPFTVSNLGPLAPGPYYIRFVINDGVNFQCVTASVIFNVTQSATPLTITTLVIKNDACGKNIGQVLGTANGGSGSYFYQIFSAVAAAALPINIPINNPAYLAFLATFTSTMTSSSFGGLTGGTAGAGNGPGDYVIYVKDANGCVKSAPIYLPMNAAPVLTLPAFASNQCTLPTTGYTFTATATGTGTLTYDTVPSSGSNTTGIFNIPVVSTTTIITVKVSDPDGCFDTKTITIYPPISVSLQPTTQPTCATNDGQITVNAIGGTGTYAYSIATNPIGIVPSSITLAGNVFSGVPFGNYTVTATNTLTGCSDSAPVTLNQPVPVAFTMTTVPVSCNGGANDGQINVTLGPGSINTPYTYQIDAIVPVQSTGLFTGISAGAHTITVRSNLPGCFLTLPVTVGQPALPLSVTGTATAFGCAANNTVNTSTITINAAGGTIGTGYLYSVTGSPTGYSLTNTFPITDNGAVQTITIYAKDSKGCIATNTVTINPLPTITAVNVGQTTAISCLNNTEIVAVTVTGGSGNFEYSLLPVTATSYQASNVFIFTTTGSYDIIVKDLTTGCTKTVTTYIVAPFNTIDVIATAGIPLICNGALSSMSFNVSGYTGAYSYEVFAGANPIAITTGNGNTATNPTVLLAIYPAGTYTVKVTETGLPLCIKTSNTITILGPPAPLALSIVTNINANCNANAQVTVNATGGTPNYTYAFVTSILSVPTVFVASPLGSLDPAISLNWFVYVKDANGCIIANPLPVSIIKDPLPTVSAPIITSNVCDFTATTYTFTANGTGLGPLSYSINGGSTWQTPSSTFTVAIPSTPSPITIFVKDKNGCIASATGTNIINFYPAIGLSVTPTNQPTCNTNDGEITVNAIGGSGNFTYTINPPATLNGAGNGFEDLAGGVIYTVKVKDNITNCERTATVTLTVPMVVTLGTFTKTDVTCNGGNDSSLTIQLAATTTTVNNNQPYSYSLIAPSPITRPNQLSPTFQNLIAGTYTVLVTSGLNCTATQTITITQPNLIVVAAPIVVQTGCTTANTTNYATITCGAVSGGNGSVYSYQFFDGAGTSVQGPGASNVYIVTNLLGGNNYTVKVTDIKGCSGTSPAVNVTPFVELVSVNVAVTQKITCLANESILVTTTTLPAGANPPLSYTVTGISPVVYNQTNTTGVFTGLGIGFYNVTVINTLTNCRVIGAVHNVYDPNTFILSIPVANIVNVACYGGNTGSAQITIIDNVTPPDDAGAFSYIIKDSSNVTIQSGNSPTAGPLIITGLIAGTYTAIATLTSLTGPRCSAQLAFTISQPLAPLSITAVAVGNVTCDNNKGQINIIPSGGTPPYTITLLNTTTSVSGTATTGLAAGVYNITVTDANGTAGGCFATTSVTLVRPTTISGTAVQVAPILCNGEATATIAVNNAAGGHVGPPSYYLYTLLNVSGTPIAGPQPGNVFTAGYIAGTYSVKITDDYNCDFTTAPIVITQPAILTTILSNPIPITCAANAGLLLTATGGTAPYSYSTTLNGTYIPFASGATTTISVGPGTYKYFVKDSNGCKTTEVEFTIQPIPDIVITETHTNVQCFGNLTGTITAVANGGSNTNYTYTIASIPAAFTANNTTGLFVNLPAGTYSITATTSGGCTKTLTPIVITQPLQFIVNILPTNVSCKGNGDGQLLITTQNSIGTVQYLMTPGNPNSVFQDLKYNLTTLSPLPLLGLAPGPYTILVQDASGCGIPVSFTITEPTALDNDPTTNLLQEYCVGDNTGGFTVNMTSNSGTPPYKVSLDNNSATAVYIPTNNGMDSHIFSGISGGDHIVYVKDKNGCLIQIPVKLDPAINIQATLKVDYICKDAIKNPTDIKNVLTVTVNPPLTGTTTYQLDGAGLYQTSPIFMNLSPGPHFVNIKNEVLYTTPDRSSICTKSFNTPIVKYIDPLVLNLIDGNLNEIIAVTSGGTAPYNYDFNGINTGANNTYIFTKTDNYFVTVTDSSGCPLTVSRQFNFIDIFIPNFFTPDGNGNNDGWGPTNTFNYKNLVFFIFDRYGRKVGTFNEGQFWDGRYDGMELPSGDYWYMIKADGENSEREFVGNFTLYR